MEQIFNKLGLAITFSPTGKALLREANRLRKLFNSNLILIHVGRKNSETEGLLQNAVSEAGMSIQDVEILWTEGDPGNAIISAAKDYNVDLLIAGALEKETFMKYYLGSVARKIMREGSCSTLILTSPSENPQSFKKFCVSTSFSAAGERTIKITYGIAKLEHAEEFVIVKDFYLPGLASTVLDSGSTEETENVRNEWIEKEEETIRTFARELNLSGVPVKFKALYGKEGWEAGNYARNSRADLFAVTAPVKRLKFLDRLFTHEIEYLFEKLPCNLLIVR